MLPRVNVEFSNGSLGASNPSSDGLLGLVVSASAVQGMFELNKPYAISSYDELETLGVKAENNPALTKVVSEFFAEAGTGTRVYLMGVDNDTTQTQMLSENNAWKLVEASQGAIRGIALKFEPSTSYAPISEDGMEADVFSAIVKAQQLAEKSMDKWQAPIFVVVEGRGYDSSAATLKDLSKMTNNRVAVLVGDTDKDSQGAAVGLLAGRIASIPVQRNIGRVKDGAVSASNLYIAGKPVEEALTQVDDLNEKGYITFRCHTGRVGYFFVDDPLASTPQDDYHRITYRRTIDKAYRIAYDTLLNELLDEVPVTTEGTIMPVFAKTWEQMVISAIASQMTANGELSADESNSNDQGVSCYVNPDQNVIATGKLDVVVRVRPYGYARYIDVKLGFQINNE